MAGQLSDPQSPAWWRHAVTYQVYVRSFADSDGDGVGDLPGITSRLPYLRDLGVDALWVTPFYTSPQHDHGYDVADYEDVDPLFGTLADADALVATAHELGLRVIVDLRAQPHLRATTSGSRRRSRAQPGSPERARYLFRPGKGPHGEQPPNNWRSVFGGDAWTRVPDGPDEEGEWYLHLFDTSQPDLDWRNPEVGDMFEAVLQVLAGPRRRRLPGRRGTRAGQGSQPAGPGRRRGRGALQRRGPQRRARHGGAHDA